MSSGFKRETRYLVAKHKDVMGALDIEERMALYDLMEKVDRYRIFQRGKTILRAVVIEEDWPEYEAVWKMIEDRVGAEEVEKSLFPKRD